MVSDVLGSILKAPCLIEELLIPNFMTHLNVFCVAHVLSSKLWHLVEACNDVAPLAGSGQLFAPLVSAWNNRLGKNQGFALQVFAKRVL